MNMSHEQVSDFELRNVCYHEWAHTVVARHYDICAWPEFWFEEVDEASPLHMWRGRSSYVRAPRRHWRAMGLAGPIADLMRDDPDVDPVEVIEYLTGDQNASESDLALIGSLAGRAAFRRVDTCVELVKRLWPEIATAAEEEMKRQRNLHPHPRRGTP